MCKFLILISSQADGVYNISNSLSMSFIILLIVDVIISSVRSQYHINQTKVIILIITSNTPSPHTHTLQETEKKNRN